MQFFNTAEKKFEGKPYFFPAIFRKQLESLNNIIENIFRQIVPVDM